MDCGFVVIRMNLLIIWYMICQSKGVQYTIYCADANEKTALYCVFGAFNLYDKYWYASSRQSQWLLFLTEVSCKALVLNRKIRFLPAFTAITTAFLYTSSPSHFGRIHPFQNSNNPAGRLIIFKKCLKYHTMIIYNAQPVCLSLLYSDISVE